MSGERTIPLKKREKVRYFKFKDFLSKAVAYFIGFKGGIKHYPKLIFKMFRR